MAVGTVSTHCCCCRRHGIANRKGDSKDAIQGFKGQQNKTQVRFEEVRQAES